MLVFVGDETCWDLLRHESRQKTKFYGSHLQIDFSVVSYYGNGLLSHVSTNSPFWSKDLWLHVEMPYQDELLQCLARLLLNDACPGGLL